MQNKGQVRRGGAAFPLAIAAAALSLFALTAGCTPEARQDVDKAGDNLTQATKKSAEGTATALEKAGKEVKDSSAVKDAKEGASKAGDSLSTGLKDAGDATQKAAAPLVLTPKVRQAIVGDDRIKIDDLNVDTNADKKQVVIMGTASSETARSQAIADAKKVLSESKSEYTVADEIKVGSKPAMATKSK